MTLEQTYDAIDLLADEDPLALRDLAWKLLGERDAARREEADSLLVAVRERDEARAQEKQAFYELGLVAAERDDARVGVANLGAICEQVMAERDAMRPVVQAAKVWRAQFAKPSIFPRVLGGGEQLVSAALHAAVDALDTPTAVAAAGPESNTDTPTVGTAHAYLSTACLHGRHADCATGGTRWDGTSKVPAQCKWCAAKCECTGCDHKATDPTACRNGQHADGFNRTRPDGTVKKASTCKYCNAPCQCQECKALVMDGGQPDRG